MLLSICALCHLFCVLRGLNNGLGLLPQMGYNTWYDMGCSLTQDLVQETAQKIIDLGLNKLGYEYVNLDDCIFEDRYANGTVYTSDNFNSRSLKPLADYVHNLNLKFGVYTDRGNKTCAGRPGSYSYEEIDANTYASWGVDYVKEDSCYTKSDVHDVAYYEYGLMRDSLKNTGRDIFFSLCGWNDWYGYVGNSLGNSFRIGPDTTNWDRILTNIDIMAHVSKFSGSGGWADPCLLRGEDMNGNLEITTQQTRSQFSMWAVMSAPLLISANLRNMSNENLETFTNTYVIAVNQDIMGRPGERIYGGDLTNEYNAQADVLVNVWYKLLADGSRAFVFFNADPKVRNITCDYECFNKAGLYNGEAVEIYDLWNNNQYLGTFDTLEYTAVNVLANGAAVMLQMKLVTSKSTKKEV